MPSRGLAPRRSQRGQAGCGAGSDFGYSTREYKCFDRQIIMLPIQYLATAFERIGESNMRTRTLRIGLRIEEWLAKEDPELPGTLQQQGVRRQLRRFLRRAQNRERLADTSRERCVRVAD